MTAGNPYKLIDLGRPVQGVIHRGDVDTDGVGRANRNNLWPKTSKYLHLSFQFCGIVITRRTVTSSYFAWKESGFEEEGG